MEEAEAVVASDRKSFDSGQGSSLSSTVLCVEETADLDISRESGEISETEMVDTDVKSVKGQDEGDYNRFSYYIARNWEERLVLDNPPAPVLHKLSLIPVSRATFITDRVGIGMTRKDRVIHMQNNVAQDFWEIARQVNADLLETNYRYIIVQVGLDWCVTAKKGEIKEGLKRLLYVVDKKTCGFSVVGVVGITPRLDDYATTKIKTVMFNRCLKQSVKDCQFSYRVEFLPWHLHFLQEDGEFLQPIHHYFNKKGEYTIAGGLVLHEVLLKSIGVIPMDGCH